MRASSKLIVSSNDLFVNLTNQNVLNVEESHLEAISPPVPETLPQAPSPPFECQ